LIEALLKEGLGCGTFFTGQHPDIAPRAKKTIEIKDSGAGRANDIGAAIFQSRFWEGYDSVLVQGDTASAFYCALAAYLSGKKIIHLEAGLRSGDIDSPKPEEAFRQMIARISDINLCPTTKNLNNLLREGISEKAKNFVVGNTVLDDLAGIESSYENKCLITLHRAENKPIIEEWFTSLNKIAEKYPDIDFILPLHPAPEIQERKHLLSERITCVSPMPRTDLLVFLAKCKIVITDSGGIQEEASFFKKKTLVCRTSTERDEISGVSSFLCIYPEDLPNLFDEHIKDYEIKASSPYGDGKSSQKIVEILKQNLWTEEK
jgi:UDP-N-acetylglucosamine 2-epimerase (non-hydrolysing)